MRESGNRSPGATAELSARVKRDQAGDEIVQDRVRRVRGVREVENQLEVYEQTSGVSSLWDQEQSDRTDWPLSATESTV